MGGLSGHMMHPHDNLDLTIGQFMTLCNKSVTGQLRFTEKIDGFNIHILKHEGKMRFARNAGDLLNNGFEYKDIDNRFSNDRVRHIYKRAWEIADKALNLEDLPEFSVVHVTLNCEVIIEGQTNIMPYKKERVIAHNLFGWRVQIANGIKKFVLHEIRQLYLRRSQGLHLDEPMYRVPKHLDPLYINRECDKIFLKYGLSYDSTLRDYYRCRFIHIMSMYHEQFMDNPELLKALFNRFFKDGRQTNLREIRKMTSINLDPLLDRAKNIVRSAKHEIDAFVLRIGTIILENTTGINGVYSAVAAGQLMHDIIDAPVRDADFTDRHLACGGKVFGIEGVVCEYKGNLYKWTGPFAPINQLLGGNR